jgi:hypothetical protein
MQAQRRAHSRRRASPRRTSSSSFLVAESFKTPRFAEAVIAAGATGFDTDGRDDEVAILVGQLVRGLIGIHCGGLPAALLADNAALLADNAAVALVDKHLVAQACPST